MRALVVNQHDVADTAMNAGKVFAKRLKAQGLKVRMPSYATRRPANAPGAGRRARAADGRPWSPRCCATATTTMPRHCTGWWPSRPASPHVGGRRNAQRAALARLGVDLGSVDALRRQRALARRPARPHRRRTRAVPGLRRGAPRPGEPAAQLAGHRRAHRHARPAVPALCDHPTKCAAGLIEAKTGSLQRRHRAQRLRPRAPTARSSCSRSCSTTCHPR